MQAEADEISGTVGGSTYEYPTTGKKVVNLEVERLYESLKQGTRIGESWTGTHIFRLVFGFINLAIIINIHIITKFRVFF